MANAYLYISWTYMSCNEALKKAHMTRRTSWNVLYAIKNHLVSKQVFMFAITIV